MCSNGTSLTERIDALAAVPVEGLTIDGLMRLVGDATGSSQRLAGIAARAVAELQVRGSGQVPDPAVDGAACPTPAWLRSVAKVSGARAGREIRTSVALREMPAVLDAVVDGEITLAHGQVLTRLVGRIEPQALFESSPQLIEVARRTDPDQLAQYVRHLIATWCEPDLAAEEAAAEDRRFLQVRNTHRGSWRGSFELADAAMEPVLTLLESLARKDGDGDTRSAGMRRADALSDVFGLALRHGSLPDVGGGRPTVTYVVPAAWAAAAAAIRSMNADRLASHFDLGHGHGLDLDQHPGRDCATAPWTGPATRDVIDTLLCDARVQRAVLDDSGQVISLTSTTDRITAAQRRAVAARDRCCTAKGCSRPPAFCDVHHLWALADGGPSELGNLVLLCRRHHVMWHRQQLDLTDLRVPWKRLPQQPRAPALE